MKKIKIAFSDFWPDFDKKNNFILEQLTKICIVEVVDVENEPDRKSEVEYLFYSCFSKQYLGFNCIRIFYTGENIIPDFNLCDYAIGFEHMSVGDRYIRYPLCYANYRSIVKKVEETKSRNRNAGWENRTKFCAMVVSNGSIADPKRDQLYDDISEYITVDSGGRYRNNIGEPNGVRNKIEFMKDYSFGLAIENVSHPGYCTEKILDCFAAGVIPIYWGDPLVGNYYNEKAFINVFQYESKQELLAEIKRINENPTIKERMMNEYPIKDKYSMAVQDGILYSFLKNIISQEYKSAYRRTPYGWTHHYEMEIKEKEAAKKELDAIKTKSNNMVLCRLMRKIRTIKNRWL